MLTSFDTSKDTYAVYYYTNGHHNAKESFHGIRLFKDDLELNSCLLTGSGGTTIHPTCAIVDENSLIVCCGDSVFSLDHGLQLFNIFVLFHLVPWSAPKKTHFSPINHYDFFGSRTTYYPG